MKLADKRSNSEPVLKTNSFISRFTFLIIALLIFISAVPPGNGLGEEVVKYTNQYRKSKRLSALVMKDDLNAIARRHSEDMASGRRSFGHGGFDQRVSKVRKIFGTCNVSENVAYGARNAKEAFTIWKNSSGHRQNMLGNYKYTGIGTARDRRGIIYYTQIFVR
jgi:uncharacterized protein YkwD